VTAIIDDWINRVNVLAIAKSNWFMCLFWGLVYYSWMLVVAWKTVHWKEERLDEDFSYKDAYWFSFITTTTVGLGDYYLAHQVLLRRDLISFALLVLVGFVFLSNFLVKLTEVLTTVFPRAKAKSLDDRLKQTNMLWHFNNNNEHKHREDDTSND